MTPSVSIPRCHYLSAWLKMILTVDKLPPAFKIHHISKYAYGLELPLCTCDTTKRSISASTECIRTMCNYSKLKFLYCLELIKTPLKVAQLNIFILMLVSTDMSLVQESFDGMWDASGYERPRPRQTWIHTVFLFVLINVVGKQSSLTICSL